MIIYEVNLAVDASIVEKFQAWLDQHIQDIVDLNGFKSAELCQEATDKDEFNFSVRYTLTCMKALDTYLEKHAPSMRKDGIDRFGDKFIASRRVFHINKTFTPALPQISTNP